MSYYIYKIYCEDLPDFIYIGSTKAFRQRKALHKSKVNNQNDVKLYKIIRENGGWDNWNMVIIEECKDFTFIQARIKEEEWREKLKANMNTLRCYITEEQHKQYNRDFSKKYREENKEQVKEYNKKYKEENKEKEKEYNKKYVGENITGKKFNCNCGCGRELSKRSILRHNKNK